MHSYEPGLTLAEFPYAGIRGEQADLQHQEAIKSANELRALREDLEVLMSAVELRQAERSCVR